MDESDGNIIPSIYYQQSSKIGLIFSRFLFLLCLILANSNSVVAEPIAGSGIEDPDPQLYVIDDWEFLWGRSIAAVEGIPVGVMKGGNGDGWQNLSKDQRLQTSKPNMDLWIRLKLPAVYLTDPTLFIKKIYSVCEVYFDGKLIYTFGTIKKDSVWPHTHAAWHLITIPDNYQSKYLTIRLASDYYDIGIRGNVVLASKADLIEAIIHRDLGRIVIAAIMMVVSFIALVLFSTYRKRGDFFSLSIISFCSGIYVIQHSDIKQLFVNASLTWFYISIVTLHLMLLATLYFTEQIVDKSPYDSIKWFRRFLILYCGISFFLNLAFLSIIPFRYYFYLLLSLRGIYCFSLILLSIVLTLKVAQHDRDALILLIGVIGVSLAGLYDILGVSRVFFWEDSYVHWGLLWLVTSMALILIRRYRLMFELLQTYARQIKIKTREREIMLRDLHDGIGAASTNISLLADVGQHSDSLDSVKKNLAVIADLSRDNLADIRSFIQSLDEEGIDWGSMISELKRYGHSIIEPHGITFRLKNDLSETAGPPGGILCMYLFKIYKEALTNVIKHAKAESVSVDFLIKNRSLSLAICDDGIGFSDNHSNKTDGTGTSKGLSNMNKRVSELGGKMTLKNRGGACIEIDVPLPVMIDKTLQS
ncbi:hypothetical protein KJ966_25200 [bacterium]|nr:hypothetical protein [bacterium]